MFITIKRRKFYDHRTFKMNRQQRLLNGSTVHKMMALPSKPKICTKNMINEAFVSNKFFRFVVRIQSVCWNQHSCYNLTRQYRSVYSIRVSHTHNISSANTKSMFCLFFASLTAADSKLIRLILSLNTHTERPSKVRCCALCANLW